MEVSDDEETYPNSDAETSLRSSSSIDGHGASFASIPADVFINICEWLSVRDILSLRMTSKGLSRYTALTDIWFSKLRRLNIPLPILPATSRHHFGTISPHKYEWLMRRSLYLELNWRRPHPVGALSRFHAFGRPITLKILPGGKYMVSVIQIGGESSAMDQMDDPCRLYALVVWDLDHKGLRVPLSSARTNKPFLNLDVAFGKIGGNMAIVIAYSTWSKREERNATSVVVIAVDIQELERYGDCYDDELKHYECDNLYGFPFYVIKTFETSSPVDALQLAQLESDMVLMVMHRPTTLVFLFLNCDKCGTLRLGPVNPYDTLRSAIWTAKLLSGQNSVLVTRVLMEAGAEQNRSTLFALEIFVLPKADETTRGPFPMCSQILGGLEIDGFYMSSLETSWFASLHDTESLLPAPANRKPPPISCYITYRNPRGFVHAMLVPRAVENQYITLPNNRGRINRHIYTLPVDKVERHAWSDTFSRPVFLPGAYRSILLFRPHVKHNLTVPGLGGALPIIRFMLHSNSAREYRKFATPATTGHREIDDSARGPDAMDVDDETEGVRAEDDLPLDVRTLRISDQACELVKDMMEGTTAVAFDESVGKMFVVTTCADRDKMIQVVDFGGENWEVGKVE
ncbi:hypothetical protein BU17DRAFT_60452 [Hysterangium stoloniferum]|nr:hypothetical protein BU17DRAFT_60452 [Hysterangium stoloniferum]